MPPSPDGKVVIDHLSEFYPDYCLIMNMDSNVHSALPA